MTRLVLLAIANHADKDGRHSWASVRQLGEEARCSERQVRYALRELETTGEAIFVGPSTRSTRTYEIPAMQTLFMGGAESAPAQVAPGQIVPPADIARGKRRRKGGQTTTVGGALVAPEPPKNRPEPSKEAETLCLLLADLIEGNGSKRPAITKAWRIEAERILRLDKRPLDEVEQVLGWCQADEFWRGNILSMPTFRAKYDRLRLAAMRTTQRRWEHPLDQMAREAMTRGDQQRGRAASPTAIGELPGRSG